MYVTPSFQTATTYPMTPTTAKVKVQGQRNHASIPGGTLLADDGSFPLRAVVQMRGRRDKQLWRRGKVQSQFLPKDLWIEAIHLYAIRPEYCHARHLTERSYTHDLRNIELSETRWMDEMNIAASKAFMPTATLPLIRYSLDSQDPNTRPLLRYSGRSANKSEVLHNAKNYEVKQRSYSP